MRGVIAADVTDTGEGEAGVGCGRESNGDMGRADLLGFSPL